MINDNRRNYLLKSNEKLITHLNEIIGGGKDKIMSQRELAKRLGCANSTVGRWLRGEIPLSIDTAIKICDILKLDKNEFLEFGGLFLDNYTLFLNNYDLILRYLNLTDENKVKVVEYIDFLLYQEQFKDKTR